MDYNFSEIEKKWQLYWKDNHVMKVENDASKPKYYLLDMFPYPSGAGLHVGHPLGYIASDIYSRFKRLKGFNVLHPMGWDAFGLPAEQYAIQTGQHPAITTEKNIERYKSQMNMLGLSYDWSREYKTSDPAFYKWTQWIFLKLFNSWYNPETNQAEPIETLIAQFKDSPTKHSLAGTWDSLSEKEKSDLLFNYRLAYLSEAWVNWCPALGTVLANDEVKDGVSERGGYPVERKLMPQWSLRITAYAERLLNDLDTIDWSESMKEAQRNWIGRSEGCSLQFKAPLPLEGGSLNSQIPLSGGGGAITVFTTRPDTVFGATFITLAPENELVSHLTTPEQKTAVEEYVKTAKNKTERERQAEKKVSGVFTGSYAIHPFTGNKLPIWVGDYVLAGYGTGAVMGVPAHDSRDFAFAKHFGLNIKQVIAPPPPEGGNGDGATGNTSNFPPSGGGGAAGGTHGYETADPFLYGRLKEFSKKHRSVPTEAENIFWQLVRGKALEGYKFRRQHIIGQYIADFVCLQCKLVIEIDGLIHELPEHKISDAERTSILDNNGFHILRFTNDEVIGNPKGVLNRVLEELKKLSNQIPPSGGGGAINSDFLNGLEVKDAIKRAIEEIEKRGLGKGKVNFRLRDAAFGRQRYWGEPIPIYYKDGIPMPLDESELPLILPEIDKFQPTETGEPPLARAKHWLPPSGGGGAHYEYTTMPGWAGSSWYYLRYMDPNNDKEFASQNAIEYWKNIDLYIGGAEHATGHLLYFRFWTKFLYDLGLVPFVEPAKKLVNQGMIQGVSQFAYFDRGTNEFISSDLEKERDNISNIRVDISLTRDEKLDIEGFTKWRPEYENSKFITNSDGDFICFPEVEKMSKSKYNVVNPDDVIAQYGADTMRMYEMFLGPLELSKPWSTQGISGVHNFLRKFWNLVTAPPPPEGGETGCTTCNSVTNPPFGGRGG